MYLTCTVALYNHITISKYPPPLSGYTMVAPYDQLHAHALDYKVIKDKKKVHTLLYGCIWYNTAHATILFTPIPTVESTHIFVLIGSLAFYFVTVCSRNNPDSQALTEIHLLLHSHGKLARGSERPAPPCLVFDCVHCQ